MVICKEDGSVDDQNQRDGGVMIVANDHLDDPASSVLLGFFARVICKEDGPPDDQRFLGGFRTRPAPSMEDPQYKISAQTDQRLRS